MYRNITLSGNHGCLVPVGSLSQATCCPMATSHITVLNAHRSPTFVNYLWSLYGLHCSCACFCMVHMTNTNPTRIFVVNLNENFLIHQF